MGYVYLPLYFKWLMQLLKTALITMGVIVMVNNGQIKYCSEYRFQVDLL